jgi:hypothetical protein
VGHTHVDPGWEWVADWDEQLLQSPLASASGIHIGGEELEVAGRGRHSSSHESEAHYRVQDFTLTP